MPSESTTRQYASLPPMASDIEIARGVQLDPITEVAQRAGISPDELELYGNSKAKITDAAFQRTAGHPDGKLVLVSAMTATRAGEGKTVTSIGLNLGLNRLGVRSIVALREPSLGPIFGLKGGAAGGGYAQVLPMEDINMHFTGDLHAVTTAHNLLSAVLDNHIHHGNTHKVDHEKIVWRRVLDLCDRQLRTCEVGLGSKFDGFPHNSGFDITASSEVMACLALADDLEDLQRRLERIVVGYTEMGKPIFAGDLDVVGAMTALLRDAIKPNLVQTTENTPALIHCGPFANIAHGCNSVRATKLALKLADVVVTEAGFATDLGAEKFFNIKCRESGLKPDAAVLVVSARALKAHGGVDPMSLIVENVEALRRGFANARVHLENLTKFGVPVVVAVNRFPTDTPAELDAIFELCAELDAPAALSEVAARGGEGGLELAQAVMDALERPSQFQPLYDSGWPLKQKIETVAREIYRAEGVDYTEDAEADIARLERLGMNHLPVCMAKTQLSLSDNPKLLGAPTGWRMTVRDIRVSHGAGFIVVMTGKMMLMPGMPKEPATVRMGVDAMGNIIGIS